MNYRQYNVAIIGAGPAGSACAIHLLKKGIGNIVLIDAGNFQKFKIGESIPPYANRLLHDMGIYHKFKNEGHEPCHGSRSFWGSDKIGYNDFLLDRNGHGWHLDRNKFDSFLAKKAEEFGVKLLTKTIFKYSRKNNSGYDLILKNRNRGIEKISARIVVDASGRRGVFSSEQGSEKINDEPLVCLSRRYKISKNNSDFSKMTFLETSEFGWWYAANLPDNKMLIALYSDKETIKQQKLNQTEYWSKHMLSSSHLSEMVECQIPIDEKIIGAPAPSYILDKIVGENWLAIGDAASTYDPITSQGITKAMMNANVAADFVFKKLNGEINGFNDFEKYIQMNFEEYQKMRSYFYGQEKRWKHSVFWKKIQRVGELI